MILFWKTIQQLEETVKLSRIQANYRFRPWIGPVSGIQPMSTNHEGKEQFSITVKNYGEIPSSNVVAKFGTKDSLPEKKILAAEQLSQFNLGPLLPNMEKRYWFFIDSNLVQKARTGNAEIFTILYFQYEHLDGNSGYGLISHFDKTTNSFVHDNMWID